MHSYFFRLCPNCNGTITDERLLSGCLCEECLPLASNCSKEHIHTELKESGNLKELSEYFKRYNQFSEFSDFFKKVVGQEMWSLQRVWARRVLSKKSFSILAPTGVGKTTFGCVTALYFSKKGKRSYLILPTGLLVRQVYERITDYSKAINKRLAVVHYHSGLRSSQRRVALKTIEEGDFQILITTERFLIDRFELIKDHKFFFVFVDDVDSFLRSPRNIDKILIALGFSEELVEKTLELAELVQEKNKNGDKIEELRRYIKKNLPSSRPILLVSGATPKIRKGKRLFLFQELLGFQLGSRPEFLRNVEDFYMFSEDLKEDVYRIYSRFGDGCLIFVPMDLGKRFGEELNQFLRERGIRSEIYERMDPELIERFRNGEYECLIGMASFRSPIARGLDLPERIRYAIFAGVPKFRIRLSVDEYSPSIILVIMNNIQEFLSEEQREEAQRIVQNLRKIIPTKREIIEKVKEAIEGNLEIEGFEKFVKDSVLKAREFLKKVINEELIEKIKSSPDVIIEFQDGDIFLVVSDPAAYLQASGRTSRLFAGGLSKGASFLLVENLKPFNDLRRKTKVLEVEFRKYDEDYARKVFEEIDRDRELMREIAQGKIKPELRSFIKTALFIVESPTKARTIARFFGRPSVRYVSNVPVYEVASGDYMLNITATMGHCYDLVFTKGYYGVEVREDGIYPIYDFIKRCEKCGEQFTEYDKCPRCGIKRRVWSKEDIIDALKEIAQECDMIFLGSDPDSEGEKIAWDIACSLSFYNPNIYRLEFHEITKRAILSTIENKREIDMNLVKAQIVRRIEDRWIGFVLSQKLWDVFESKRLSAGRVQTPVLGWIVERTEESKERIPKTLIFLEGDIRFEVEGDYTDLERVNVSVEEREDKIPPLPPFTTDMLLKEASSRLGSSVSETMQLAQDLFECGLITYHRTDSTTVSTVGMGIAKEYIEKNFPGMFRPRSWQREGAHECIRPTKPWSRNELRESIMQGFIRTQKPLTKRHLSLYELIFNRFIASQMKEPSVLKQIVRFKLDSREIERENIVKIIEDGFNKVIPIKLNPAIREGELKVIKKELRHVPKAYPFTQGEIIAYMKERNIGRPSTYAKIVSVLFMRKYVFEKRGRVISTALGKKVYSFLLEKYRDYVSEELTRRLEKEMDEIENGERDYQEILKDIYREVREIEVS